MYFYRRSLGVERKVEVEKSESALCEGWGRGECVERKDS
jgi:hypothetical protein